MGNLLAYNLFSNFKLVLLKNVFVFVKALSKLAACIFATSLCFTINAFTTDANFSDFENCEEDFSILSTTLLDTLLPI